MNKRLLALLLVLFTLLPLSLASCQSKDAERTPIRLAALKGPTGMGMVELMKQNEEGKTENEYEFTLSSAPDEVTAAMLNGSLDIAAVPVNLAAVLYQKAGGDVQVAAVNTLGVLYLLENGDTVHSMEDLRGQTIYATGQGSTPEYVLRYLLTENGLDPDRDVTIEYVAEHAELATRMAEGSAVIGVLPEPNVTTVLMNNDSVRIALDLTQEWDAVSKDGSTLVQGVIVVSRAFAEAHPDALNDFLDEYGHSVTYVIEHPEEAAEWIESYGIVPKKALALRALPQCNLCCLVGSEMKEKLEGMYAVLFEANPASIGGKLPDEAFYYSK